MKQTSLKLTTIVLGVFFIILLLLLQRPRGGSSNGDLSMGRKLTALEPIETKNVARSLEDSIWRDHLEREVDHLMKHEYPSPVKPRKRTPVHNGLPNGH
ncbi:PREDICTED: uncharacterized protein LOC104769816 [Camelina sativa]|uniref:Uncharacterized protein LOC104769816 n=1 Tax=Camelina sativa TaxID=90675 RepID=A0ABM0XXI2_CAMSA|nr:PREDICTED: uncharacterized protein LOC104769816 [Camelina sativa]